LVEYAERRLKSEWTQTSAIMALTANVNRDPKSRPFTPNDFNPFTPPSPPPGIPINKQNIKILKKLFVDNANGIRRRH